MIRGLNTQEIISSYVRSGKVRLELMNIMNMSFDLFPLQNCENRKHAITVTPKNTNNIIVYVILQTEKGNKRDYLDRRINQIESEPMAKSGEKR